MNVVEDFQLIFGIQQYTQVKDFHYPEVFIATCQKGKPTYVAKLGTDEVISSYELTPLDGPVFEMIQECRKVHPTVLEKKYSNNKSKPSSLAGLMEDKILKSTIQKRMDEAMATIVKIAKESGIVFYYHVERSIYLPEIALVFSNQRFKPFLKFDKTALGINYSLSLKLDGQEIIPSQHVLTPICYTPAIVILDSTIYSVDDVDGLKLKPFLAKPNVFIPDRLAYSYFKDFVADLLGKAEITVTGMEYETVAEEPIVELSFAERWIAQGYDATLTFIYGVAKFGLSDLARDRTQIHVDESNHLSVRRIVRNEEAEANVLSYLKEIGLELGATRRLYCTENSTDPYDVILLVNKHSHALQKNGIRIAFPSIDNRKLSIGEAQIHVESLVNKDWFDLKAIIKAGDEEISFSKLLSNIRINDRIFHLQNGMVFIIPLEWMEKYATLAKFANYNDEKVQVYKSNFALLENLGLIASSREKESFFITEEESFDYEVSPELKASLRPYQVDGAKWLVRHHLNGLGACLADDMGLGKTVQTLALLLYVKQNLKGKTENQDLLPPKQLSLFEEYVVARAALCSLVVLPASLVFNWESEIKKFAPSLMVVRHIGKERSKDFRSLAQFDIILTTYQTLLKDFVLFSKIEFQYIVLDESHYIKNRDSKIFIHLTQLRTQHRISLSGTPIENSLADLWSQMQFINPDILGNYAFFKKHFQDPIEKYRDISAIDELKQLVAPFILRRTKSEVLSELPDLDEQVFYSEMDEAQAKLVDKEKSMARNQLLLGEAEEGGATNKIMVLNVLMRLRQLANHPLLVDPKSKIASGKYEDVTNALDTIVASGNKVLVFSGFVKHLEVYEDYLKSAGIDYAKLTGEDNQADRQSEVEKFNNDPSCMVFLMSIKAGGVGLNLTAASYVIILDPWWNPFVERQAIARAHRMGQENKVTVIRFIAKNSIEEKILKLQVEKLQLADQFVDVGAFPDLSPSDLTFLLS